VNDKADQYTFHLRKDVKFHDGTPFNADAVKFTFDRIVDPALKSQSAFSSIGPYASTQVVDPYTAVVKFKTPFAPFLSSVAGSDLAPVSPDAVKKYGADFGTHPVGTGAFKFDSYTTDSVVRMVKNPDYAWGPKFLNVSGPPHLDAISWRIIPEASTRLAALRAGEVQVIQDVPTQEYANLQNDNSVQLLQGALAGSGFSMMMNVTRPPTDDVKVRQALEWGVDKEAMIKAVWQGVHKPATSPLTSNMFGYDPATANIYKYDPQKAASLLDEAGWVKGSGAVRQKGGQDLTLAMYYRSDNSDFAAMATFLQAIYQQIGINIDLHGLSQSGYFDAVRQGMHNLQFWWETGTDPDVVRVLFYGANADGGTNRNRYKNAEMDQLIDQAAGTTDSSKRTQLYAQIQKKVLDEAVMAFFADPLNIFAAAKSKVSNVALDWSSNNLYLHNATLAK
jgi:peptide/nickel transport system substrate-binding protein